MLGTVADPEELPNAAAQTRLRSRVAASTDGAYPAANDGLMCVSQPRRIYAHSATSKALALLKRHFLHGIHDASWSKEMMEGASTRVRVDVKETGVHLLTAAPTASCRCP